MASYASAKEEIKRAADIVELIGQYVRLKKVGRNYVGLCPFHAEKAPSFTVSAERQMFHCFGCKKGGDIFAFWMEYHRSTFPEAFRDLAERYQVPITQDLSSNAERERAALRKALFEINDMATAYFQESLRHPSKGDLARAYLNQRALSWDIISEFKLGYAPDEWGGLTAFLRQHGGELDKAVEAGLIIPKKNGGYYDRFRGRIIFPIFNLRQQVVGFGGRVLDQALPKYLNSPETPLFRKGEFLYGLHGAFKAARDTKRAVVVEGYMDFLALRRHGLHEVVATLGTALTGEQVRKLKGYVDEALVVFDSDRAGVAAALKSLPLFLNEGLAARAMVLPEGHDPDSFVNAKGLDQFLERLDGATPMFDFYLEHKLMDREDGLEGTVRILKEVLPALANVHSRVQRSIYVKRLSERLEVKEEMVWAEMESLGRGLSEKTLERNFRERLNTATVGKRFGRDLHLLNLLIYYPRSFSRLVTCDWRILLTEPAIVEIVETYVDEYGRKGSCSAQDLLESLRSEAARKQLREAMLQPSFYSDGTVDLAVAEFEDKVNQIRISAALKRAKERGDIEGLNEVLKLKAEGPSKS